MKKSLLIAVSLTVGLSVNAQAFSLNFNEKEKKLDDLVENVVDRDLWFADQENSIEDKAKLIQDYVKNERYSDLGKAEDLMIDTIKASGEHFGAWESRDSGIESEVMASDDLISLERVLLGKVEFKEVPVKYTVQKDPSSETRVVTGNYISRGLMRDGRAPVGPDGLQLVLCRLFNMPDAKFYELSSTQAVGFINASESNMNFNEACITFEPLLKTYWKKRLSDIIDEQNSINLIF
ncbi:hypothetical protein [Psychromonas sp. SP041]|uniref:hypothetical protein n=1 Tax=Psychromonas sp. SP041 TaxID=1365007 RepID=UPI00040F2FBE|nr:hypothetical protein [Psychromonas sp. SP041]